MREAHVEIGTASRPTVETDMRTVVGTEITSLDFGESKTNPLLECEAPKTESQLNAELAESLPLDPIYRFDAQSGPEGQSVGMPGNEETEQNILFKDQQPGYSLDIESVDDPTRQLQDTNDVELADFFERPVKIFDERWGTGITLADEFNPWERFFEDKRVVNRIANFNLMRCKLHLKFVINGNGFQYGRVLAAYHPLLNFDEVSSHAALVPADLVQTSQLPHIYLDPTTSTGGEMTLPFFWFKNNVGLLTSDLRNMGTVLIRELNPFRHANDATDVANISVFAWASGVEMNVLTSRNPTGMTPQSGKEKSKKKKTMTKSKGSGKKSQYTKQENSGKEVDEANHAGMISGPATAISKAANALSFIPQIAPFAMATSKVAGTVATVAKALGYSRPPVTKNPDPFRPTPTSQLATTTTPDTAIKLTVDDKQELSIDPSIAGIGSEDPMSIKGIASRESYLTTFDWNIGTDRETLLWNSRVSPVLWRESGSDPKAYHFPACAMAALPFVYWTGTMKFRFQIVSSVFHKGRLRFVYDPHSLNVSDHEYNVNYMEVVDIAETKDFTLEIGNGQDVTLLTHNWPNATPDSDSLFGTTLLGAGPGNGTLSVQVVNELTTPSALSVGANDIQINVFVSMGDDFEVFIPERFVGSMTAKPTPTSSPSSIETETMVASLDEEYEDSGANVSPEEEPPDEKFETQSGTELVPDSESTEEPSAPEHSETCKMGPPIQDTQLVNKVYTGEAITSFRPLLKRYNLWRRETVSRNANADYFSVRRLQNMFPFYRGAIAGAVDYSEYGPYNYCNTLLLHWVTLAHQGWRGSIRYKMITDTNNAPSAANHGSRIYVERQPMLGPSATQFDKSVFIIPNTTEDQDAARTAISRDNVLAGPRGMVFAQSSINPCVEFEVPYYSHYRFTPGKRVRYTGGTATLCDSWRLDARMWGAPKSSIDFFAAAGEDFQVYFWTGLPRMYLEEIPPQTAAPPS